MFKKKPKNNKNPINKLYVKFENLDDHKKVVDTYINIFKYITEYYAKNDSTKLSDFLTDLNLYFSNFYYLYNLLLLKELGEKDENNQNDFGKFPEL